ncbi:ADP-ribose pyrophosphatase YjhB, NUDIX family [Kaistia soli DSM 19436]|uniref:ADP-ribose pyrophosphatase YjhB, NUDIX family n=1 Tax=Kaistia soli DSM 19436 TaxID=1122133 RepID=A0A1M5P4G5_9HYPH|nr:NUDIX hydrolase [Kaistia soli]SHG96587.1 ADP-ribose pyrophosphatase YjhB, NUDIX family [Kaistia soli DSM 19436]
MRHCACAILVQDGRLLLGKRAPHRKAYAGKWDVIGGRVEDGEALEDALVRELREEIGVAPLEWEDLCSLPDMGPEAQGPSTYHMFAVRAWTGGQPRIANHEHSALRWFTVAEASALADLAMDEYRSMFWGLRF